MKQMRWIPFLATEPVWYVTQVDAWVETKRDEIEELRALVDGR